MFSLCCVLKLVRVYTIFPVQMKIALIAKKGGVGKSTLAVLLHEAFRQAGKRPALRDWDLQGTSTKALELIRKTASAAGGGTAASPADSPAGAPPDVFLYDTPPNLDHVATAVAVREADVVLVVTSPSPADIWEAEDAVRFVRSRRKDAPVKLIFNKVRRSTLLGRLVAESAREISAEPLAPTVSARECYQHALAQGWRALDGAAREEILQLAVAILADAKHTE